MLADVVVAVVDDAKLSTILPAVHRSGLGHVARALHSRRGDTREQLRRAGIPVSQSPALLAHAERLLLITAAARSPMAADLLLQQGAIAVWIISPAGVWREIDDRTESVVAAAELLEEKMGTPARGDGSHGPTSPPTRIAPDHPRAVVSVDQAIDQR